MPFNKLSFLSILVFAGLCLPGTKTSYSQETTEESSEAKAAPAEDGENAEAEPHPDSREWAKRTQKLKTIETRIREKNTRLQALIKGKNNGQTVVKTDKQGDLNILEVIVDEHRELLKLYQDYDEERREVKFRYPGGANLVKRRYLPLRAPSLEQLETEMGLDGELTLLRKKIDKKYSKYVPRARTRPKRVDNPEATLPKKKPEDSPKKLKLVR